ncbi:MAG: IS21 family transposase, partial [Bacillota bacterium]|nr:IS21 family transposase [Bacillota bacterium]
NFIEEQFVKGNRFDSMEDLNSKGKEFVNDWCNEVHTTTKRIPNEFYENEEKTVLQPLPKGRLNIEKQLVKRIISYDSYISVSTNKYSLPVKYAGKQVQYRLVYGFRIEVYTMDMEHILTLEQKELRHGIYKNDDHYADIKTVSKSIPQIRRDFTAIFENGGKYLEAAGRKFDQPTYHARKLLQLLDLYESKDLDKILAYALAHDILDVKSIKELIKDKGYEIIHGHESEKLAESITDGLIRNCDYYEENKREAIKL